MTAKATMDHPRRSKPGAVFGRRQGHKLSPRQGKLIATLLPRLALDLAAPPDLPGLFAPPAAGVRLEIGFGGGEHLVAQAERHPRHRLHRGRAVRQRHGQGAVRDRRP